MHRLTRPKLRITDPPPPKKTTLTSDRVWAWIGMEGAAAAIWSMKIGRSSRPKIAAPFSTRGSQQFMPD